MITESVTPTVSPTPRRPQEHPGTVLFNLLLQAGLDADTARQRIHAHAGMIAREQQYLADADAPHVRVTYRLEYRECEDDVWQPGTAGIGVRWSCTNQSEALAHLAEARQRWPHYEHQLVEVTTTVTQMPLAVPGAP
ncbi:hypothetical protein [Streptomyces drozdowiczii]|uniref:Uncharacterized protein n=1 Tax=Streptomyces drozdowiczii TaxID=202862 RepID=A0ABY6Q264_9ACTN|nr:hypothetical protein [Streptomyces drozdowiczii]MCX0247969.1 hypothetical protein [Streptomyces drozdowiczii]UZK58231.1 hypothetical protein NEH16_32855 [Streptomyces drozdowiczii]